MVTLLDAALATMPTEPSMRMPAEPLSPDHSQKWAAARLRLGQTNVGLWVLTAVLVVALGAPDVSGGWLDQARGWTVFVGAFVALQLMFDLYGGYVLPVQHGQRPSGLLRWGVSWARGVWVHSMVLAGAGGLALALGQRWGDGVALTAGVLLSVALLALQGVVFQSIAGGSEPATASSLASPVRDAGLHPGNVQVVATDDQAFVGGWVGWSGARRLLVPRWWLNLPAATQRALLQRRRIGEDSGMRATGATGAVLFNTIGATLVLLVVPGAGFSSAAALLTFSAGFTLWSFLGLLSLPTLSRRAVFALDHAAVEARTDSRALIEGLIAVDAAQGGEPLRGAWKETIFHPVPARARRMLAIKRGEAPPSRGAWRITRTALFTGWAHFSWLSRSVHCNVGRPELWVVYPGD